MFGPKVEDSFGWHASMPRHAIEDTLTAVSQVSRVVQLFITSPQSCDFPDADKVEEVYRVANRLKTRVIWHGPFTTSMVNARKPYLKKFTTEWVKFLSQVSSEFCEHPTIVIHVGKPVNTPPEEAWEYFRRALFALVTVAGKSTVCLENDPRAATMEKGKEPVTTFEGLAQMLLRETYDKNIKICFDTEHAWASGHNVTQESFNHQGYPVFMWDLVGVVHLNSLPGGIECGSGKDRHGETRLVDSQCGTDWIKRLIRGAKGKKIPMILERSDSDVLIDDLAWVKEFWGQI